MNEASARGLLAIWANVDPDYQLEFVRWHNCEHVPERVAIPGYADARARRRRKSVSAPRSSCGMTRGSACARWATRSA